MAWQPPPIRSSLEKASDAKFKLRHYAARRTLDLPHQSSYRSGKLFQSPRNVISQKAKYAFKALVVLARRGIGASLQTDEIAAQAAIPRKFLEQILLQLKANGLVESRRGRAGGYLLVADPATITVSQVLRIVDGPIAPLTCISRTAYSRCKDCPDETHCAVRKLFAETYAATLQRMEKTTLAVALGDELSAQPPHLPVPLVGHPRELVDAI